MAEERASEKPVLTTWEPDDSLFGLDASQANPGDKNVTWTMANFFKGNATGDWTLKNQAVSGKIIALVEDSGSVERKIFECDPNQGTVGGLTLPDLVNLALGDDDDTNIKFNGTNFRIANSTGETQIINNLGANGDIAIQNLSLGYNTEFKNTNLSSVLVTLLCLDPDRKTAKVAGLERTKATASSDSDAFDVSGISVLEVDTTAGNVTLGGLSGGVEDQDLRIVKVNTANSLIIENEEGTGTQKFGTADGNDITLTHRGGVDLHFDGTLWLEVSH